MTFLTLGLKVDFKLLRFIDHPVVLCGSNHSFRDGSLYFLIRKELLKKPASGLRRNSQNTQSGVQDFGADIV